MRFLVYMYYTHPCYQTSIFGKNCAYYIRIFTVNQWRLHNVTENQIKERVSKQIRLQHVLINSTAMYTTTAQRPS